MKSLNIFGKSSGYKSSTPFNVKGAYDGPFSLKGTYEGHYNITYQGIPCLKCPNDYVIYQMIINEVQPDLIVEIGTNNGGSALYMAHLLDVLANGVIHTIDIDDRSEELAKQHPRIKFFHNGWEDYDLSITKEFKKILVIEDSSHHYENTLNAIEKFSPLVTVGSYLIVEDGIIDEIGMSDHFQGGPIKAIKEFLPKHPEYIIDENWINMFGKNSTFNVMGYLKKVKK
jgi:cephalosporin hydroxylase